MRILLVLTELKSPRYKGGIQVFNNFLVKALLELGHELRVISTNDAPEDIQEDFIIPCNSGGRRKLLTVWNTLKHFAVFKPDLVICGHVNFSLLCLTLNWFLKAPYIVITHGMEVWNLGTLNLFALKRAERIMTVSNFTRQKLLKQLPGVPAENIRVIHNTIDVEKFKPKVKPQYLMDKWGISDKDRVVLTICRLTKEEKEKGYGAVLESLKIVAKAIPDFKYVLGGSGPGVAGIKEYVAANNLGDKVILTGFIPEGELVDYYNLCDVFVLPSKQEGFGIVFIEALSCGKPVVAGNIDGSVDAVLAGEIGVLVNPDDVSAIASAIASVLLGTAGKNLLDGAYLRKRVVEAFGFEQYRKKVGELVSDVGNTL